VEIFISIVQRKVLTPTVADSLEEWGARTLAFEDGYRRQPQPVRWKFTRQEFDRRLQELERCTPTTRSMILGETADIRVRVVRSRQASPKTARTADISGLKEFGAKVRWSNGCHEGPEVPRIRRADIGAR
jgi:hypothetical protein